MLKHLSPPPAADRAVVRLPIDHIRPNPRQPRRRTDEASIARLAESIRLYGQLSPILVRPGDRGHYQLIAGQRRLSALKRLGRSQVDAVVLEAGDFDSALIALSENLQRESLHYLDEAEALRGILNGYPVTQERLAASLSMSPSALASRLKLLKLPPRVREAIRRTDLPERHARALLKVPGEEAQLALVRQAAEQRMSVRRLETLIDRPEVPSPRQTVSRKVRDNRIIINAVLDTVKELNHIGVRVRSRVEEAEDHIDVVVTIPLPQTWEAPAEGPPVTE